MRADNRRILCAMSRNLSGGKASLAAGLLKTLRKHKDVIGLNGAKARSAFAPKKYRRRLCAALSESPGARRTRVRLRARALFRLGLLGSEPASRVEEVEAGAPSALARHPWHVPIHGVCKQQ